MLCWKKWIAVMTVLFLLSSITMTAWAEDDADILVEAEEDTFYLDLDSEEESDEEEDDEEESGTKPADLFQQNIPSYAVSASRRPEDTVCLVPQIFQNDYPNVPYGGGSVATSGCSMTTIAMVASYLREEEVGPDKLADMFRHADGSHVQRMEAAAICMDLDYYKTGLISDVIHALRQEKVAIIMVGSSSDFTSTQHFLVLTGIREDGRIFVNDSNKANYSKSALRDGFQNGFSQSQLFCGFGGAWIFDGYTPLQEGNSRYDDLDLSQEETDMLAKLIWREARGESIEGQQAVAEVVLNRMMSDRFPTNDAINTIMAKDQFRTAKFMHETTADPLQYKAIERALKGPNVLPEDVFFFARTEIPGCDVWGQIGRHVFWY